MIKPLFYFDKLNTWDKVTIALYSALTGAIWHHFKDIPTLGIQSDVFFAYAFTTQLFLYCVNYISLRNLSVYIFWFLIGILHLCVYIYLRDLVQISNRPSVTVFRNTLILLILFQVLRLISVKIQHQELVAPAKGSRYDLFEERKVNILDFIVFVTYLAATAILLFS